MAGNTKVWFILGAFAFITITTQLGALMGATIITNAPPYPTIPVEPTILDYIIYPFVNLGYFFTLMSLSSGYAFMGVILGIITIGLIWAVIELVRGV